MVFSLNRWQGKVAIVTGASSGIGAAIAEKLVGEGLLVAGLARRKDRLESLAKKLSGQKGKLHPVKCDVSKEDDILSAFKWISDHLGPVHILVNNAGLIHQDTLSDGSTEKWRETLTVNVLAVCICTREAIKIMRGNNISGHIIHINSVGGHTVPQLPNTNVYTATKHAVTALTETLRQELNIAKSQIKITSISPGYVATEILSRNGFTLPSSEENALPHLNSEDVADAVIYVLSTPPHVQIHELMIKPVGEPF